MSQTQEALDQVESVHADEGKNDKDDPDNSPGRGQWKDPFDFFVSCLGYAVGLGNIWRFPFLCYQHGGGSFLIPYFVMLILAGLPILTLEMTLGQFSSAGPIKTFLQISPMLKGLGYAMVSVGMLFAFFYIVVVSWSMWFMVASFQPELAWENCDNEFNSRFCRVQDIQDEVSVNLSVPWVSPSEEYWNNNVLGLNNHDWDNFGFPRWRSALALFSSWLVVVLCLIKGIKASGKVVYFTSFFPYVILIALAARSISLPGALDGVLYFLTPDWKHLLRFDVWTDAATQIIFSLGPGCGCVITLSSYNAKNRNCCLDAIIISFANCLTSLFCGMVVFAMLGFKAFESGKDLSEVVQGGPGLAFVIYPEIVTKMSGSNLWAFLFFAMLILLALGSIFAAFETVISALTDHFNVLSKHRSMLVIGISLTLFVLGLPFTCGAGIHIFTVFNSSAPSWNLLLFTFLEVICLGWVYKAERALENYKEIGLQISPFSRKYWMWSWKYITPLILGILLIMSFFNLGSIGYGKDTYPLGIQVLGNVITVSTVFWIPLFAMQEMCQKHQERKAAELKSLLKSDIDNTTNSGNRQSYQTSL